MSTTSKENEDITDGNARPQRKPKINRRNFHLHINDPLMNLSDKCDKKKPNLNGDRDTENKGKSSVKELISFSSNTTSRKDNSKEDKHSSTIIRLKKSSCHENNTGRDITIKNKPPSTIISLKTSSCHLNNTSYKGGTVENKQPSIMVTVKRSSFSSSENENSDATAVSGSEEPKKKKHKPITWP